HLRQAGQLVRQRMGLLEQVPGNGARDREVSLPWLQPEPASMPVDAGFSCPVFAQRSARAAARTPSQPLNEAITSGIAPKMMKTRSPGRRSHSITCERGMLM